MLFASPTLLGTQLSLSVIQNVEVRRHALTQRRRTPQVNPVPR